MGVPKFYRWISERYPCLSEVVKEHQISEFDNLYLDMNGIIHVVSHPDDGNPHFRITEEKIFRDVFHYIDVLFRLIKPRKVFFMAIDGVAPRAKMNQQRGRRFRSAREAEELIAKALSKGETLPSEERFDSNCITPGTPFMVRLQEQLKYFVTDRISNNALWQGPRVYLSGHETPGEGEHKIMDFIRSERANPNHDPNTRHCLYGLDADLMMLGLTSHEPHFSLLREEVRFGGKESQKRSTTPEDTTFHLLHLSLMREYIDFEFSCLKTTLPFKYDLERIIDDWILMGFLVGNDFIPHLPHLHIDQDGLPLLWGVYMNVLPDLGGYINEDGKINLERMEKFMAELAKSDMEKFSDNYADLKWFAAKTGGKSMKNKKKGSPERKKFNMRKAEELYKKANKFELPSEIDDPEDLMFNPSLSDDEDDDEESPVTDADAAMANGCVSEESQEQLMMEEFKHHKRGYYMEKLHVECVTLPFLQDLALQYVRALQWILYYYYDGCPSWSWFYPYHYAPFISDIHTFSQVEITFELGRPFLPFQQLMAVLPSASKKLLPPAYWPLMLEETSPIFDFYPKEFETDLNGKRQEWEAVVLIPFIEEKRLLAGMASKESNLTQEEKSRNVHGPCRLFKHCSTPQPAFPSSLPGVFPDILVNYAKCTVLDMWEFVIPRAMLKRGLFEGVLLDVHFPGFPTFKHLPHKAKLKKANVKVFQSNSRGENMIVTVENTNNERNLIQIAKALLDRTVFVRWPHLVEARVEAVSDGSQKISVVRSGENKVCENSLPWQKKDLNEFERNKFYLDREGLMEQSFSRRGVDLGQVEILVYVQTLQGRRYICGPQGNITLSKQYGQQLEFQAHQMIVTDLRSHNPGFQQFSTLEELYPPDCDIFMIGKHAYGTQGKVIDIEDEGRIRVKLRIKQEPDLADIQYKKNSLSLQYMPAWMAAQKLSISSHLVSKITGSYRLSNGQGEQTVNIGLNLKSNVKEEEVPGFTRKENGQWLYSTKVVQILDQYMKAWPTVFEVMGKKSESDITMEELFPEGCGKNINDVTKFVKTLECFSVPRVSHGCLLVDEPVISLIEKQLVTVNEENQKSKRYQTIQVRPHLLYRPIVGNDVIPDSGTEYKLFDRVVNARIGFSVPLGLRGTIIGIYPSEREIDTMYEVLFDEEFVDGLKIRCSGSRAYRMYGIALINISHGDRKNRPPHFAEQYKNNSNSNVKKNGTSGRVGKKKDESEFNNIWNDLKVSKYDSPRKGSSEQSKDGYEGSYLKCLKKEKVTSKKPEEDSSTAGVYSGKLTVIKKKKPGSKSTSRQIAPEEKTEEKENGIESLVVAASALASVQRPTEVVTKPKSNDSKPKSEDVDPQFAALMSCLEISQQQQQTTEPERANLGTAEPIYGKKLSLEELFKVAQKEPDNVQPQQQQQAPVQSSSAVSELEAWALNHGLPAPRYDFIQDGPGLVKASVLLGNRLRFLSSSVKTKDQATQSAAAIALRELQQSAAGPTHSSAFRPVQPAPAQGRNHVVQSVHPLQGSPVVRPPHQMANINMNMIYPQLMAQAQQGGQLNQPGVNMALLLQAQALYQAQQYQQQQQRFTRPSTQIYQPPRARQGQNSSYSAHQPTHQGSHVLGQQGLMPRPDLLAARATSSSGSQVQVRPELPVARTPPNSRSPARPELYMARTTPNSAPPARLDLPVARTTPNAASPVRPELPGSTSTVGPEFPANSEQQRKRADSASGNPFVPLQVARQQKTPQRKSESVEREESKPKPTTEQTNSVTKTTPPDGACDEDKPKKTKKKASRRMAANFPVS